MTDVRDRLVREQLDAQARRRLERIGRAVREARTRVEVAEGQLELAAVADHEPRQLVLPLRQEGAR